MNESQVRRVAINDEDWHEGLPVLILSDGERIQVIPERRYVPPLLVYQKEHLPPPIPALKVIVDLPEEKPYVTYTIEGNLYLETGLTHIIFIKESAIG